jgi:hypothetical protein
MLVGHDDGLDNRNGLRYSPPPLETYGDMFGDEHARASVYRS